MWFSPNTPHTRSKDHSGREATPPDLDEVFKIIGEAQQAIVFLVFEPDRGATTWDRPALQAATGGISPAVGPHSVHRRSPAGSGQSRRVPQVRGGQRIRTREWAR